LRANDDDTLQQNTNDDLLDLELLLRIVLGHRSVETQQSHREEVSVTVGEAELIGTSVDDNRTEFVVGL
jgi:hypothetical protein